MEQRNQSFSRIASTNVTGGDRRPSLLLFAASGGGGELEQALTRIQWAIGIDLIQRVLELDLCDRVIVASGAEEFIKQLGSLAVTVERDPNNFHFGQRLRELIQRHGLHRPLYVGAGSTALLDPAELTDLCRRLGTLESGLIANNFWSCDFAGFVPGEAIERISAPEIDNNLAFLLNRTAGLPEHSLPRTAGTQFDVDTPSDLLVLAMHPRISARVRHMLDGLNLDTSRLKAIAGLLVDDKSEVVVAGRVGSAAWLHLEQDTACRIRLFSEERGMRASGREERGEARSLLGFYVEKYGARGLFDALAELGQGAIMDSRVIFSHLKWNLSASDRFRSDLLLTERIADPRAREFSAAARDARIPIVLGGHSLVSGGLWALVEAAWASPSGR